MAATPLPLPRRDLGLFLPAPFRLRNSVFLLKNLILQQEPEEEKEKSLGVCLQFYSEKKRFIFYAGISV